MIRVITGYMGSGKSLYAVRWIYRNRKKFKTLVSNAPLDIPFENTIVDADPLYSVRYAVPPIVLFIDEAHLLMDSRRSMSKRNVRWTHLITLIRKLNVTVVMTTQSLPQVDIRLQFFIKTYIEAQGLKWLVTEDGELQPFFVYDHYRIDFNPWSGERVRFFLHTEPVWYYNAAKYFSIYDTNYIPEFPAETNDEVPVIKPDFLVGKYTHTRDVITKMKQMGLKVSQKNYKEVLRQLGLDISLVKKVGGQRVYEVFWEGQKQNISI